MNILWWISIINADTEYVASVCKYKKDLIYLSGLVSATNCSNGGTGGLLNLGVGGWGKQYIIASSL